MLRGLLGEERKMHCVGEGLNIGQLLCKVYIYYQLVLVVNFHNICENMQ